MDFNQNNQDKHQNQDKQGWENARENWEKLEEEQAKKNWDRWNSDASHSTYYNQPTHVPYDRGFAIAALVMGILSLTSTCCGFSLPLGALGLLFAVLCKRRGKPLNSLCQTAIALCIIGIIFQILLMVFIIFSMRYDPQFMEQLNQTSQTIYGMDFEELLRQSFGPFTQ